MRIYVDIDGVLADQIPPLLLHLNQKYGLTTLRRKDICAYDLVVQVGSLDVSIGREANEMMKSPLVVASMLPIRGAAKGMSFLCQGWFNEVIVVTARPPEARYATIAWLMNNNIPFDKFVTDSGENRWEHNGDILIDDKASSCLNWIALNPPGRKAILFSQPWNEGAEVDSPDFFRAHNWAEVVRACENFSL